MKVSGQRLKKVVVGAIAIVGLAVTAGCIAWSPDGSSLVVGWSVKNGQESLYTVNVDGSDFTPVPETSVAFMPSISPNGKEMVFTRPVMDLAHAHLMLRNEATGEVSDLATGVSGPFAWRRDSQWFVGFAHGLDGSLSAYWYSLNEMGEAMRIKLPFNYVSPLNQNVIWLPNSDDIAVLGSTQSPSLKTNVYTVEAGEPHQITKTGDVIGLSITPDGKNLIWARRSKNAHYILFTLYEFSINKRTVRRLSFPEQVPGINPNPHQGPDSVNYVSFSPDGQHIAVAVTYAPPQTSGIGTSVLYMTNLHGGDAKTVLKAPATSRFGFVGKGGAFIVPFWSADGKKLAALDQNGAVWVCNADGSGLHNLNLPPLPQ